MKDRVVIIGAGIGGLASALRLAHQGCDVTVIEAADSPGGKMRTVPSAAGPVDAGPTVLTMRPVFDELFTSVGEDLTDHVTLTALPTLARHFWDDGTRLDLMSDPDASAANIGAVFGPRAAQDFHRFRARAARLFAAFDGPMMQAAEPSQARLTATVLRQPRLIADMAPHRSLAGMLQGAFREPKLRQLFARYATYVGGSPLRAPALLSLIAESESRGVWAVQGGMHHLAQVIARLAGARGARFHYATRAQRIEVQGNRVAAVHTTKGRHPTDIVLFNGDPRALTTGLLGDGARAAIPPVTTRSLSADVLAFAAQPQGADLSYHNVFFGPSTREEFVPLQSGQRPDAATLYLCAQDRASIFPAGPSIPGPGRARGLPQAERFEIIRNAPPTADQPERPERVAACLTQIMERFQRFGLTFAPPPTLADLTTPHGFARAFPASQGSLYGQSPHGLTAGLKRPTARTGVPGLYLTGGGAHPGAGVPMAVLSARHAAAAIMQDRALISASRRVAMPGGMSMPSATTGPARSA